MGLDTTTASGVLKEFYLPAVREQLNSKADFLAEVERNAEDVEGLEAVLSLHVSRNGGIGSRVEGGYIPAPGEQGYVKQRVGLKRHYGAFQVSGPVIKAMKSDDGSWLRAVESESKGLINDIRLDHERQLLGTSDGVIAPTAANTALNTIVLAASATQIRQFYKNMRVDIGTVANPIAVAQSRRVTGVNRAARTITIDGPAVTTTVNDRVFRSGNGGAGAAQKEVHGLQTIVADTGTLFGVDPSVEDVWRSYVLAAGNVDLSDALIGEVIDEVALNSPSTPDWAIATHATVRKFIGNMASNRRYINEVEFNAGFKGVEVGTGTARMGLMALKDCPDKTAFFLSKEHLKVHEASDWEFMEEDGNVLDRYIDANGRKDAYEATLFKYDDFATDVRGAHGKITGLLT